MNRFFTRKSDQLSSEMARKRFAIGAIMWIAVLAGGAGGNVEAADSGSASQWEGARTDGAIDRSSMRAVLKQPLNDLNLLQADIPGVLKEARSAPYSRPAEATCDILISEIQKLDAVLGQD